MATENNMRAELAADDGSLPERWNPEDEPGTTLIGTLLRFETIVTEFGASPVAVIEDGDDGTVYGVALFRSVLKKKFDTLEPKPGDVVGLKYIGLIPPRTKDGRPYHNYAMRVDRVNGTTAAAVESPEQSEELPF
jgi:hypothetical protein